MRKFLFVFTIIFCSQLHSQVKFKNTIDDVNPVKVGNKIANSNLIDKEGVLYKLTDLVKNKKTIFIIYRGGWCPYCNEHLGDIAEIESKLVEMGYQIFAVSPDTPEELNKTIIEDNLNYTLLSDADGDFIQALSVGYKVKSGLKKGIKSLFYKIKNDFLPVPSLFIVDDDTTLLYSYISGNYKERISIETLLKEAEKYKN